MQKHVVRLPTVALRTFCGLPVRSYKFTLQCSLVILIVVRTKPHLLKFKLGIKATMQMQPCACLISGFDQMQTPRV